MEKPKTSNLLLDIARCPNVQKCLDSQSRSHPCTDIVLSQDAELDEFHIPEPWNGQIDKAPILFISSNPSITKSEMYPKYSWPDHKIEDYFNNRFDGRWIKISNNRFYPMLADETYARASNYWGKVRRHAETLLQRDVKAGCDYAITEVVHCKSVQEIGVNKALLECSKYLPQIISVADAKVIVVIGKKAQSMVKRLLGISDNNFRFVIHDNKYWIFVDHSYSKNMWIENVLSSTELNLIRNVLQKAIKNRSNASF